MKKRLERNIYYRTADLALATTLSLFLQLEEVNRTEPRRAYFIFQKTEELEQLLDGYWKRTLRVEPRAYFDQLKALKTRLYEQN